VQLSYLFHTDSVSAFTVNDTLKAKEASAPNMQYKINVTLLTEGQSNKQNAKRGLNWNENFVFKILFKIIYFVVIK
jgi:hypothetical protein